MVPRNNSVVMFVTNTSRKFDYPFEDGSHYLFLGEIPNVPGCCVVAEYPKGEIYSGYQTKNFVEVGAL